MRTLITSLTVLCISIPAFAQLAPAVKAVKVARVTNGVLRNAQRFNAAMTLTPPKKILNLHLQYKREYHEAVLLYNKIQHAGSFSATLLEKDIDHFIINNTLKHSLLEHLREGNFSSMQQEMEEYFHLTPFLPFFANSAAPQESFAYTVSAYLRNHPHKPSWPLREVLKFGDMRRLKPDLEESFAHPETAALARPNLTEAEAADLMAMYQQAEEVNATIRNLIAKETLTRAENEELVDALRTSYTLYEQLIQFARNSASVRETLDIYKQLVAKTEAFMIQHKRAPQWENPEERELANLFPVLAFHNSGNLFEEMIPIMKRLYELSERYPAKRMKEADALHQTQLFVQKHNHLPRPIQHRTVFDTKPDEAILVEAILYWKQASPAFTKELNKLYPHPESSDTPPSF